MQLSKPPFFVLGVFGMLMNEKYVCPKHGKLDSVIVVEMCQIFWDNEAGEYSRRGAWEERVKCPICHRILDIQGGQ
jgi:hypothetical protein